MDENLLRQMCALSAHRGPDDEGVVVRDNIGLGHRRLSIIDLDGGHQPLSNEDGSTWLVFNGEIYNFRPLRRELEARGHRFRTDTDSEVIVHLYEEYGAECVRKLNGMFAFAIWDDRRRRLFMARDRLGQKPLHYAHVGHALLFASEIQPLLANPDVPRRLDENALDAYLTLLYVPSPHTMLRDVRKLPPAHYLVCEDGEVRIERYWDVDFTRKTKLGGSVLQEEIIDVLEDATRLRLMSDVPLGAFLSGGIDSSLVTALMSRQMNRPVRTFSVGFEATADGYNELPYARIVADHLGTDHTEFVVRPRMAEVLPELVWHYGEPFGDNSCIPTYYLSKLTRSEVTVALSGDGGDELFAGYRRYVRYADSTLRQALYALAARSAREAKGLVGNPSSANLHRSVLTTAKRISDVWKDARDPIRRYRRLVEFVTPDQKRALYTSEMRHALNGGSAFEALDRAAARTRGYDRLDRLFYLDLHSYLPEDILVKVDIASMAHGLEVRSPFLDYRVVELAASIPSNLKVRGDTTKDILKQASKDLLPESIRHREKKGFGAPVHEWMRGHLAEFARDVLLEGPLGARGLFEQKTVERMLEDHVAGRQRYGHVLWLLLNFELWCRTFLDCEPAPMVV